VAQITITTTPAEDKAIQFATARYNAGVPPEEQETPLEFFNRFIRHALDHWLAEYDAAGRKTRGELYARATPEDQAAIDAILEKYA
jgi:hypothetical protein